MPALAWLTMACRVLLGLFALCDVAEVEIDISTVRERDKQAGKDSALIFDLDLLVGARFESLLQLLVDLEEETRLVLLLLPGSQQGAGCPVGIQDPRPLWSGA